jgi:hypothetical protein
MNHFVTLIRGNAGSDWHGGPGFTTAPGDAPKPPKTEPRLSVDDPLKPRLKSDETAEMRYLKQRELIDAYKAQHPGMSADKIFADLTIRHPEIFTDDDESNEPSDEAKKEVVSHFRDAGMSLDRVYATIGRLNPEFFQD